MSMNLEIPCAFEYFRGSWGYVGVDFIQCFPVQNSKYSSPPASQMVAEGWPHPIFAHSSFFPSVNYAGKGLLSTQACSQHGYGFITVKVTHTHTWELPSTTTVLLIALEQLRARCLAQGHFDCNSPNLNNQILPNGQQTDRTWAFDLADASPHLLRLQLSLMCSCY